MTQSCSCPRINWADAAFSVNALLFFYLLIKAKSAPDCEKGSCQYLLCSEWSTHLYHSRGLSSWDHSCRFRCLPGRLRVQSTGPCRRPEGSHIPALPTQQSSGTLPGHKPLGLRMLDPGSPLKRFQRESVRHSSHLLFPSFRGNLASLFEPQETTAVGCSSAADATSSPHYDEGKEGKQRSIRGRPLFLKISDKVYKDAN